MTTVRIEPADRATQRRPRSQFVALKYHPDYATLSSLVNPELNTMSVGIEPLAAMVLLEIEKAPKRPQVACCCPKKHATR